jgi:hypothetical protein
MLLESSERGVRKYRRMSTLVLPQRFVGDTSTKSGETSPAFMVHACSTHSGKAMSTPFGRTT